MADEEKIESLEREIRRLKEEVKEANGHLDDAEYELGKVKYDLRESRYQIQDLKRELGLRVKNEILGREASRLFEKTRKVAELAVWAYGLRGSYDEVATYKKEINHRLLSALDDHFREVHGNLYVLPKKTEIK